MWLAVTLRAHGRNAIQSISWFMLELIQFEQLICCGYMAYRLKQQSTFAVQPETAVILCTCMLLAAAAGCLSVEEWTALARARGLYYFFLLITSDDDAPSVMCVLFHTNKHKQTEQGDTPHARANARVFVERVIIVAPHCRTFQSWHSVSECCVVSPYIAIRFAMRTERMRELHLLGSCRLNELGNQHMLSL